MAKGQITKASTLVADDTDVDNFLNDENTTSAVDLSPEEIEKLDLTQIPPPDVNPAMVNTKKSTVAAPTILGSKKSINFSRFGSNKRPITTDLSDAMLPPITRKNTAIYQLLGVDSGGKSKDTRIDTNESEAARIVDTSDYEMHPTYSIYDQFEQDFGRRNKVVTFYDGVQRVEYTDPVTKERRPDIRQKVGSPRFSRGQAVVDIMKNYHQFLWWELHPGNINNKFRDRSKAGLFERIDLKHYNPHVAQVRMELKLDAMNYVRSLSPDKASDLAAALNIPTFREQPSTIKTALYAMAETNPEGVMYQAPNKSVSVTITIMRALDFGILDFDAVKKQYFWAQNSETPIFQVPMDEQPERALAKYLVEEQEGEEIRAKMDEFILYWV